MILTVAGSGQAATLLFGVNQNDYLLTIDTSTGAGTLVGSLSTSMSAIGLAQTGGSLFAFDTNGGNVLERLDPLNASTLAIISVGLTASDTLGEGDLAFRSDGMGFVISTLLANGDFDPDNGSLFSLDLTGHSHAVVKDGVTQKFSGLAFNPINDELFGLTADGASLFRVDATTGAVTLVGATGIAGGRCCFGGLTFRPDGALFGILADASDSTLYQLNTTTGQATMIGDVGFDSVSGIAFANTSPVVVPEPPTGLLVLVLPAMLLVARKFRKES